MCKNWWSWTAVPLRTLKGINYCSQGLEFIMCIKLQVYLLALNFSFSSLLVSDHLTCRIYSVRWPFGTFGFPSWNKTPVIIIFIFFHSVILLGIYPNRFALVWFVGVVIYKAHTHTINDKLIGGFFYYLNCISMKLWLMWNELLQYFLQFIWHLSNTLDTSSYLKYICSFQCNSIFALPVFFLVSFISKTPAWNIPAYK